MSETDLYAVCANCGSRFGDHRTADDACPKPRVMGKHAGFREGTKFKIKMNWIPVQTKLIVEAFTETGFADSTDKLTDVPESLIDGLIEYFSEDLGCDHSVGICMCGLVNLVASLRLAKMGKTYCPDCNGDGDVWSKETRDAAIKANPCCADYDTDSLGYSECSTCNRTGFVEIS